MNNHHLPVSNGLSREIEGAGNRGKTLGPVQPVASEDLLLCSVDVDLDAVAVIFNFMKPLLPVFTP